MLVGRGSATKHSAFGSLRSDSHDLKFCTLLRQRRWLASSQIQTEWLKPMISSKRCYLVCLVDPHRSLILLLLLMSSLLPSLLMFSFANGLPWLPLNACLLVCFLDVSEPSLKLGVLAMRRICCSLHVVPFRKHLQPPTPNEKSWNLSNSNSYFKCSNVSL